MNNLDTLKDIKSSSIIQVDFLPYIFSLVSLLFIIIVLVVLFIYFKNKRRKKLSKEQIAKNNLKNLDFNTNTKELVYSFTINGYECLDEKNKDEFEQIVRKLTPFKYKRKVDTLSGDLISDMQDYIKVRV